MSAAHGTNLIRIYKDSDVGSWGRGVAYAEESWSPGTLHSDMGQIREKEVERLKRGAADRAKDKNKAAEKMQKAKFNYARKRSGKNRKRYTNSVIVYRAATERYQDAVKNYQEGKAEFEQQQAEEMKVPGEETPSAEQASESPGETPSEETPTESSGGSIKSPLHAKRMRKLGQIAKACAAGNQTACNYVSRLKAKAQAGNRRAAETYNAIQLIMRRGLAGVAGVDIGFAPIAAWAGQKYGPKAARYAIQNQGKIARAAKLRVKAKQGDPKAIQKMAVISQGAKAGDPDMKDAAVALTLARGYPGREPMSAKLRPRTPLNFITIKVDG